MSGGIKLNFNISKAMLNEIPEINKMLTDLIQDERKNYDSNINENGVRIDIWTHLMRGCIIMYTNLKGVCQKWQKEKYTMKILKRW